MNAKACGAGGRDRAGWAIVILNLLMVALSMNYFMRVLGAGWEGWLAMNSCAPSILIFSLGYLLGQRALTAAGAGAMCRYGTLGLLVFGWRGMNLLPQAGHILMTIGVVYFVIMAARRGEFQYITAAALVMLALLYSQWQSDWFAARPGVMGHLMRGTLSPAMFR